MFVSLTRQVPLVKQKLHFYLAHMSTPMFFLYGGHVSHSLVFRVVFCISLLVFLSYYFWPLYCLSFYLWLLITPLVSGGHCIVCPFISSPGPNQRSMWTIAITWRPSSVVCRLSSVVCSLSSVNFSHFKLLLRNHWADWNQT